MKKETKKQSFKIKEVAVFSFGLYQNAVDVSVALSKSGRLVNIVNASSAYLVYVYERN